MAELGEATVAIRATLDGLDRDLGKARGMIEGAIGDLQKVGTFALTAAAAGATAAIAALGAGLAFSVNQALEAEQGQARLAQVIKSTGGAAGLTQEAANALAQEFMNLAGGSDDAVLAIEQVGLQAGSIAADEMPAFIQASLDLGTVMGDTAGAALLLARAQEDPIAALSRLQRSGILFTASQKEQVAAMVKAGDAAGATALIMDRVAEATGGAAAANAETLAGQWAILQGQLGEAAETVGTAILPVLHDLFDNVLKPAIPVITEIATGFGVFIEVLSSGDIGGAFDALNEFDSIRHIFQGLGIDLTEVGAAVENAADTIQNDIVPAIQDFIAQVTPVVEQVVAWLGENVKLQDVLIALGVAIAAVVIPAIISVVAAVGPVILIFAAVVAAAALLRQAWESDFGGIQEKTVAVIGWLTTNISAALAAISAFWSAHGAEIMASAQAAWTAIQAAVSTAITTVSQIVSTTLAAISAFWSAHGAEIMARAQETWNVIVSAVQTAITTISNIITVVSNGITAFWSAHGAEIMASAQAIWSAIVAAVQTAITTVSNIITVVSNGIRAFWAAYGDDILTIARAVWEAIVTAVTNAINTIRTVVTVIAGAIQAFWATWGESILTLARASWENIRTVVDTAIHLVQAVIQAVAAAIRGDWHGFGEALRTFWSTAWEGIKTILSTAGTAIQAIVSTLITNVKAFFTDTDWGAVGRAIIDGISAGIRNAAGFLGDAARAAAQAALDAAKGLLGIHSPSAVFEGVGKNMMLGMAKGITENLKLPSMAMGGLLPVMGLVGEDVGTDRSVHYSSVTTVNTNQDPLRVLRASRHLDKLGAMA